MTSDAVRGATGRGSVQSVERAMAILEAMGRAGRPLSVREIGKLVALPRPTVYRLLGTLGSHGAVAATDGGYVIGSRILWLAAQRLEQTELRAASRPHVLDLRDDTGLTVHVGVLEQGQVVYIEKAEPPGPLRMASAIGRIMPAHCTSLGKAMLACMPEETVRGLLRAFGMPRRTPRTITDPEKMIADLAATNARGYAIDNIENEDGIRCVGAPIFDHRGAVAGAVSLSGSTRSVTLERIRRELGPRVREAAERISRALGWAGGRIGA